MSTQDIPTKTITLSADQWQTILDTVEYCWDEKPRPTGEGWQSGRLSAASAALSAELAKPEPAELVASLPKLVTSPTAIRPVDRYELGDAIRRAWLKHGQDSWCAMADEVFAALAQPEPAPTDEELDELDHDYWWLDANHSKPWIPFARTVLERYGNHTGGTH